MSLRVSAARYVLGILTSDEIRRVADDALNHDVYTPELAEMAFNPYPIMADVGPQFERALAELKIDLPSREQAVWIVIQDALQKVASGAVPPRSGLAEVLNAHPKADLSSAKEEFVGQRFGIEHLVGSFYGYDDLEDRPSEVSFEGRFGAEAVAELDKNVMRLAVAWLERNLGRFDD